jgi:uncharacterized protein HemX
MENLPRSMTVREKWRLVLFVLEREWVLVATGFLVSGISLSALLSRNAAERAAGVVLALLLWLAMGLYIWIKLQSDLRAAEVCTKEIEVREKRVQRQEATVSLYLVDRDGQSYEVSQRHFNQADSGQTYRLTCTSRLYIVLAMERA